MNGQVTRLARFGGQPSFADTLHVGRPNIGDRQELLARFEDMLDRRWLSNRGPYVRQFEEALAEYLDVKHCVTTSNATVALELAARALGFSGEVIIPSFTFVATAHALQWQGVTPVFCDISPGSPTIDPARIEALISPRTTGIIGVHVWGHACDIDALANVAERNGLGLLFDAAHAFGCTYKGKLIGRFGRAEVFSFHATKVLNSFEGGAVATNDDQLAEQIRLMENFGFSGVDNVVHLGINGKMSEASAAMGLTSLESLNDFIDVNHRNYHAYRQAMDNLEGISLREYDDSEKSNFHYIVIEVDEALAGISRDMIVDILQAENVLARRYFYPGVHLLEPYRSSDPHAGRWLAETERLAERVISLPTGTGIDVDQIQQIADIIRASVEHSDDVRIAFQEN